MGKNSHFALLFVIVTVSATSILTDYAFAISPQISTYVGNDPDDGDNVYSDGDTLTITFNIPTNQSGTATSANILGNFTFSQPLGASFSGVWSNSQTLVITVSSVAGGNQNIGVTTVSASGTNTIGDFNPHPDAEIAGGIATLSGDFGNFGLLSGTSGSGCSGDCISPTLGLNKNNQRVVDLGFSYNSNPVDVERWYTDYPLIKVETGKMNVLQVKVFDDRGINNIRVIRIAFGVPEVGQLYSGETIVEFFPNEILGNQINVIDKNHLLDKIKIRTWPTQCNKSDLEYSCLLFRMEHMFREAPLANPIGISVSDNSRNSAQFYFNEGVKVAGASFNPPNEVVIPLHTKSGEHARLIQIDRENDIWIDSDQNFWTKNSYNTWYKISSSKERGTSSDRIGQQGLDREHIFFKTYMNGQELLAKEIWDSKKIQSELPTASSIYFEKNEYLKNLELEQKINGEIKKANKIFQQLFDIKINH